MRIYENQVGARMDISIGEGVNVCNYTSVDPIYEVWRLWMLSQENTQEKTQEKNRKIKKERERKGERGRERERESEREREK